MELVTIGAGYLGCALVRLAIHVAAGENGWAGVKAHLDIVTERVARRRREVHRRAGRR
jgi:hypothetical protein